MGFFHAQKEVVIHMASRIQGITVEIGGDTTKLSKALESVNNIKTAVGGMSDEVKQGFADMKDSIGELSSQTSSLGNAIRSLGDTFNSDFLKSLGNGISKVGDTVNTVTGLVDKLGSMKNTIGNLGSTMQNLGNVLGTENGGGLLSNIGSFNRQLKKVTKSKTVFPSDDSLLKMLYLATMDITKKWTGHRQDWGQIHSQLEIYFEERLAGRNL